jgi:hypothetical protein
MAKYGAPCSIIILIYIYFKFLLMVFHAIKYVLVDRENSVDTRAKGYIYCSKRWKEGQWASGVVENEKGALCKNLAPAGLFTGNVVDLYVGGSWFRSRQGHRLSWLRFWILDQAMMVGWEHNREVLSFRSDWDLILLCRRVDRRGPLSLVITTEELLEKRSSGSGLENRD